MDTIFGSNCIYRMNLHGQEIAFGRNGDQLCAAKVEGDHFTSLILSGFRGAVKTADDITSVMKLNGDFFELEGARLSVVHGMLGGAAGSPPDEALGSVEALSSWLKANPMVTELGLQKRGIDDDIVAILAEVLPSFPQIVTLDLFGNNIGPDGAETLARTLQNTDVKVRTLELGNNKLGDEGTIKLAPGIALLTSLGLFGNKIGDEGAEAIAKELDGYVCWCGLDLTRNSIGDRGAIALAGALSKSLITKLAIAGNAIGLKGGYALINALPTSKINGELKF